MEEQKFNPVVWFEIYVDDMDRAAKFYESILGVILESLPSPTDDPVEMRSFPGDMANGGASGALVKMEGVQAGGGNTIVYFGCEDCAVEESRVTEAGGTVSQPKMSIGPYGFCSMVTDTEGNTIGLHSLK